MNPTPVDILLVEDDPADAELTIRALRRRHLANRIDHVEDGAAALEYLFRTGAHAQRDAGNPRLILLDLKLPKVDGLEVLRRIKSDRATSDIPVVVLTSSSEDRDVVEGYHLGLNSYVQKPVDFDAFVTAVEQVGLYWLLLNQPPKSAP